MDFQRQTIDQLFRDYYRSRGNAFYGAMTTGALAPVEMIAASPGISAADLVEAQMRQIEVDGAIHKDNLIAVAKMHGCK